MTCPARTFGWSKNTPWKRFIRLPSAVTTVSSSRPSSCSNTGICLPQNRQLLADLCTPKWKLAGNLIQVESREEIMKKLGKSPDFGSAYILALIDTPKRATILDMGAAGRKVKEYDPYGGM